MTQIQNKHQQSSRINNDDFQYQQDILKMKEIWKDLKKCDKQEEKEKKNNKRKINQHKKNIQKRQKQLNNNQKQNKKKNQYEKKNKKKMQLKENEVNSIIRKNETIQFSTLLQGGYESSTAVLDKNNQKYHWSTNKQKKQLNSDCKRDRTGAYSSECKNESQGKDVGSSYKQIYELKGRIQTQDKELSLLRINNQRYKDIIRRLENEMLQKDNLIEKLKDRENQILATTRKHFNNSGELTKYQNGQVPLDMKNTVQYMNYKNDCKRLLEMLKTTTQFTNFASLALEDQGVRFLNAVNPSKKKNIFNIKENNKNVHFCSCNKEFIDQQQFWVPQKIYDHGKQFLRQRNGEITQCQMELLMYELNRIWKEREKKMINRLAKQKVLEVKQYKRKIQTLMHSQSQNNFKDKKLDQ